MKKILHALPLSLLLAMGSAFAQNVDYTSFTTQKNFASIDNADASNDVDLLNQQFNPQFSFTSKSDSLISLNSNANATKNNKSSRFFQNTSTTNINLSSNSRFQYGLGISVEPYYSGVHLDSHTDYFAIKNEVVNDHKNQINTSAFANYQVNPNFSLTSSVSVSNANNTGYQLSAGGRASKIFNRNHRITAMLNLNWSNQGENTLGYWSQAARQSQKTFQGFGDNLHRTELRLGASWNWNIDTNWSLTTGATLQHMVRGAQKNPFSSNPVTVFSVASYRF